MLLLVARLRFLGFSDVAGAISGDGLETLVMGMEARGDNGETLGFFVFYFCEICV